MDFVKPTLKVLSTMSAKLSPAEKKFFDSITKSKGDWKEFLDEVPSAVYKDGKLTIDNQHLDKLSNYVDDVVRLNEGDALPPSFHRGDFYKKFFGPAAAAGIAATGITPEQQAMAASQALQEPAFDPVGMLAGGLGPGSLVSRGVNMVADPVMNWIMQNLGGRK